MSVFSDLLGKAKQLEIELAKEGTVLVGDAAVVLQDLLENLQHEVNKEVGAPAASTPTGEPAPNADAAEAAKADDAEANKIDSETPPAPDAPADGEVTPPADAPTPPADGSGADVQKSSDLSA